MELGWIELVLAEQLVLGGKVCGDANIASDGLVLDGKYVLVEVQCTPRYQIIASGFRPLLLFGISVMSAR